MEKDFNKLIRLLKINSTKDLFTFENGEIKLYDNRLDFKYDMSIFHNQFFLDNMSNMISEADQLTAIDVYNNFIMHLAKSPPVK